MFRQVLRAVILKRGLNQSQLAELAGISRQAVSLWFKGDGAFIDMRTRHLLALSQALKIDVGLLLEELPLPLSENLAQRLQAKYLWDFLYVDLTVFSIALLNGKEKALGRFVQVSGLYAAAHLLGEVIWQNFEKYKRFIITPRRKQCEVLWKWKMNRT